MSKVFLIISGIFDKKLSSFEPMPLFLQPKFQLSTAPNIIVSGDKDLLTVSGYKKIQVIKPAAFVENYLNNPD